jgi:hypothetical protein
VLEGGDIRRPVTAEEGAELREIGFESGGGDDLEQACWLVGGVPEGVWDTAGLDHDGTWSGLVLLVADLNADSSLQHDRILILVLVRVYR